MTRWLASILLAAGLLVAGAEEPALGSTGAELCEAGAKLYEAKMYAQAAAAYEEALQADPKNLQAHYALGLLYLRHLDRPLDSLRHLRRVLSESPDNAKARQWLIEAETLLVARGLARNRCKLFVPSEGQNPAKWPAAPIDGGGGEHPKESKSSARSDEGAPPGLPFADLRGHVTQVEGDRVGIDVGAARGAAVGMQFSVYRKGRWIGMLTAVSAEAEGATCAPIAGRRAAPGSADWGFERGDEVRQREDVVGIGLAQESSARKALLGWERDERRLRDELKGLAEREATAIQNLLAAPNSSSAARFSNELRGVHAGYREWNGRYTKWLEEVLETQQSRYAGNPHVAAYRTRLLKARETEAEASRWREIGTDIQADLIDLVARGEADLTRMAQEIERKETALNEQAERINEEIRSYRSAKKSIVNEEIRSYRSAKKSIESIVNEEIRSYRSAKKAIVNAAQTQIESAIESHEKRRGELEVEARRHDEARKSLSEELKRGLRLSAAYLNDFDLWMGRDEVYELAKEQGRGAFARASLGLGQYALAQAKYRKAERAFRDALAAAPEPAIEQRAAEGLERALLRQLLEPKGQALGRVGAPLLTVRWRVPAGGRLRGGLRSAGGAVVGCFETADEKAVRTRMIARDPTSGGVVWEFSFTGAIAGDWVVGPDEVILCDAAGFVYRLDAKTGGLISRIDVRPGPGPMEITELVRAPGSLFVVGALREEGGKRRDFVQHLDFEEPSMSSSNIVEGRLISVAARGSDLYAAVRLTKGTPVRASAPDRVSDFLGGIGRGETPYSLTSGTESSIRWVSDWGRHLALSFTRAAIDGKPESSRLCALPFPPGKPLCVDLNERGPVTSGLWEPPVAYAVSQDGLALAIDLEQRSVIWASELPVQAEVRVTRWQFLPSAGAELALLCSSHRPPWVVSCIDKRSGRVTGTTVIEGEVVGHPVFAGEHVYFVTRDSVLKAVSMITDETVREHAPEATLFLPTRPGRRGDAAASPREPGLEPKSATRDYGPAGDCDPLLALSEGLFFYSERGQDLWAFQKEPQ